jgi:two-component system alkaline phosphatase synthesis response regulator PhoP
MESSRKRILVVDDEPDITFTLDAILQKGGYEVSSFNNPLKALQSFRPRHYDLLIIDIKMPEMNGFELYRKLNEKDSYVKVCFLTAVSEFRDYEQYKGDVSPKPNERYFVAKPVSEDDLVRRVKAIIANNNNITIN